MTKQVCLISRSKIENMRLIVYDLKLSNEIIEGPNLDKESRTEIRRLLNDVLCSKKTPKENDCIKCPIQDVERLQKLCSDLKCTDDLNNICLMIEKIQHPESFLDCNSRFATLYPNLNSITENDLSLTLRNNHSDQLPPSYEEAVLNKNSIILNLEKVDKIEERSKGFFKKPSFRSVLESVFKILIIIYIIDLFFILLLY